jgi:membrane protein implicated in regulation of membrane protease activity
MEAHFAWVIAGLVLVIAELVTGTFYLLVLGMAALAGAAVAYFGGSFWMQAVVVAAAAVGGVIWIQRHKRTSEQPVMPPLDLGQPVTLDSWINRTDCIARVKYRNALWDAQIEGDGNGETGEVFYIVAVEGNTLRVAKRKPA